MALPININELLNGRTVEWERIEFKKGWNPEGTIKTITAFANDFNNWGGGYIIIGIEEDNGKAVLPPIGLHINKIDFIQKELNRLCRKIIPNYFPIIEPVEFQNRIILILWCPGGSIRPYKCPESFGKSSNYFYYLRKYSSTVKPNIDEEHELISMSNKVPFDDRINHLYSVADFDLSSIKTFLNRIGSELENEIPNLSIDKIARRMNIAEGSDENLLPKNIGLLFFAKGPQEIFPSAKIEIVNFSDESGTNYTEKIFTGNILQQLTAALDYLKNQVVKEKVIKNKNQAEAKRFYNYPYQALEEALCNAVYHRGYDNDSPIEVRINPSSIDIISFPGPLPPLSKENLENNIFDVRKYRNRRIGEFLKELQLTEGRATGIPTIIKALEQNGSPAAIFETDTDRNYFKTSFNIHPIYNLDTESVQASVQVSVFGKIFIINNLDEILSGLDTFGEQISVQVSVQVREQVESEKINKLLSILRTCIIPQTRKEILLFLKLTNHPKNYENYILPLISNGIIKRTISDKPKSRLQKYVTTEKGKKLLTILSN